MVPSTRPPRGRAAGRRIVVVDSISQRPPAAANWRVYCGYQGFVDVPVTLTAKQAKQVNSAPRAGSLTYVAALVTAVVLLGLSA